MFLDALELLEPKMRWRDLCVGAIDSKNEDAMNEFLQLTDHVLRDIYNKRTYLSNHVCPGQLDKASELVNRLLTRDFYKYISSAFVVNSKQFGHQREHVSVMADCLQLISSGTYIPNHRLLDDQVSRFRRDVGLSSFSNS